MTCPHPEKPGYDDRAAATTAAARIRHDLRGPALVPYPCRCGQFHLKTDRGPDPELAAKIATALPRQPSRSRRRRG